MLCQDRPSRASTPPRRDPNRQRAANVSWVPARVIVLNGGSSAGKSFTARALQLLLPEPWLTFGTDVLGEALPRSGANAVVTFGPAGQVWVTPGYRPLEHAWYRALAAVAAAGSESSWTRSFWRAQSTRLPSQQS